ncbi:hypothetical protein CAL26_06700 [Bordetella genomosp. 9]|uniref:Inclusion body protein n=1 Tax=Bordetella genomosp. 9 TaxID=1416803 RepID=A0A261RFR5_9BORD|nr:hypothetical protein [Bordetella genomosp. 9]OZI23163.1 hypothetical protein CAL26_06700 [Bordetella genomosp. 9]
MPKEMPVQPKIEVLPPSADLASRSKAAIIPSEDWSPTNPQTVVRILVDTASVAASGGGAIGAGQAYMMDNRLDNGSGSEATLELLTVAHPRDYIGFYIDAVNPNLGDQLAIMGFAITSGDVFGGSAGHPVQKSYNYWVGQIINASNSTYRISCSLTTNGINQQQFFFSWDPYLYVR